MIIILTTSYLDQTQALSIQPILGYNFIISETPYPLLLSLVASVEFNMSLLESVEFGISMSEETEFNISLSESGGGE